MSIGSISSLGGAASPYQINSQSSTRQQRQQDFQALAAALNSNDLAGAQSAFASLQQDLPQLSGISGSGSSAGAANPISSDFQSLSQALQSGDLSSAQSAFGKLQQDLQALRAGGHQHHHHGGSVGNSSTDPSQIGVDSDGDNDGSSTSTTDTTASTPTVDFLA